MWKATQDWKEVLAMKKIFICCKKINARSKHTEFCWIFFGLHTAKAINIANRIAEISTQQNQPPPQKKMRLTA